MKNEFKDELFEKVLDVASRVTGCRKDAILSKCRHEDLANTRRMMVSILHVYGYSISHISRLLNMTNAATRHFLNTHPNFMYYKKYEYYYNTIKTQLES